MSMGICWFDGLQVGPSDRVARQEDETERERAGGPPPLVCDTCGDVVPDGEGVVVGVVLLCHTCQGEGSD